MALELAPYRIRVNAIAPGLTDTAQPRYGSGEAELSRGGAGNPVRAHGPSGGNRARRGFSGLGQRRICDRPDLACKRRVLFVLMGRRLVFDGARGSRLAAPERRNLLVLVGGVMALRPNSTSPSRCQNRSLHLVSR